MHLPQLVPSFADMGLPCNIWDSIRFETSRRIVLAGLGATLAGCRTYAPSSSGKILHRDPLVDLSHWFIEAERPGHIAASAGVLDIDVPAGVTLWFRPMLQGPVEIDYEVTAVSAGGPNDAVSDVNAFWMATDSRAASGNVLDYRRSGAFSDYDELRTYYAGIGGNRNSTSRFRRYIGRKEDRPLLPQHDLRDRKYLLEPNRPYRIRLIADGSRIELRRDGETMFRLDDPQPYPRGHFGLRTTKSHIRVRDFTVRTARPD